MRLNDSGKLYSIFLLDIAKIWAIFTTNKKIIDSSFEYFKDKDFEFSINFTFQDIANEEISNYVIEKIKELNIGNRVVLKLLRVKRLMILI